MICLQIIDNLLLAFHLRKTCEVEALVAVEETEHRHLEVAPPAPSPISTLKTNRHSHWLTIKLPLPAEAVASLEEEEEQEARLHMVGEVVFGGDGAALLVREVIKINAVVDGGAGVIGTRFVFLYAVLPTPF
jgi:hypothetical protein